MLIHLPQHLKAYRYSVPATSTLSLSVEEASRSGPNTQSGTRGTASILGVWGIVDRRASIWRSVWGTLTRALVLGGRALCVDPQEGRKPRELRYMHPRASLANLILYHATTR